MFYIWLVQWLANVFNPLESRHDFLDYKTDIQSFPQIAYTLLRYIFNARIAYLSINIERKMLFA